MPKPAIRATLLAALAAALLCCSPSQAATFNVLTTSDSGSGSLREAIRSANASPGADHINFAPLLNGAVQLRETLPVIRGPLSISGPGSRWVALDGGGAVRLFDIREHGGGAVRISGLTLRGGKAGSGGAISSHGADLALVGDHITHNKARLDGGAIAISHGSLAVRDSVMDHNFAPAAGGAARVDLAGLSVVNSQINKNWSYGNGGGFFISQALGKLSIRKSVLLGNSSGGNGGAISVNQTVVHELTVSQSQVIKNTAVGNGGGVATVAGPPTVLHESAIKHNASGQGTANVFPTASEVRAATVSSTPSSFDLAGPASGSKATLINGIAYAPADAPERVKEVIAAANAISRTPYVWGGGHASFFSSGFDCSGAVSFALHGGGFLETPLASPALETWGEPGPGKWITVYANAGHAYAVIAGLRWDTVGDSSGTGPRWHEDGPYPGFVVRHPAGF